MACVSTGAAKEWSGRGPALRAGGGKKRTKGSGDTSENRSVGAAEEDADGGTARFGEDRFDRAEGLDRKDDGTEDQIQGEEGVDGDGNGVGEFLRLGPVAESEDDLELSLIHI